ncbi:hypothetical protein EW14_1489 [Prochlorococcus sp. MIT 0604]|nr:hypothetical protein EW14_1489 [Prochlorococcus sp. MIT 0604]
MGEPIIYNLVSIFVLFFKDFSKKIDYDLVPRYPYAFGIKEAFTLANIEKVDKILIIEFGVASGSGLFNMSYIASKLSRIYKVDYEIIGFDTGVGMPKPLDYKDHPEKYREGDFPSLKLKNTKLPEKTRVIYGEISGTIDKFVEKHKLNDNVIGFVSLDVDYYSSTKEALKIFNMPASNYLSRTPIYNDDESHLDHNDYCGALLAINEFNKNNELRKFSKMHNLRNKGIFKNASFLDQMYFYHVLDHEERKVSNWLNEKVSIFGNPYIGQKEDMWPPQYE